MVNEKNSRFLSILDFCPLLAWCEHHIWAARGVSVNSDRRSAGRFGGNVLAKVMDKANADKRLDTLHGNALQLGLLPVSIVQQYLQG